MLESPDPAGTTGIALRSYSGDCTWPSDVSPVYKGTSPNISSHH